jgi:hypothetical protein
MGDRMPGALSTVIIVDKSNEEHCEESQLLHNTLPATSRKSNGSRIGSLRIADCREPPVVCDLAIHLRTPHAVWFPWARLNVLVLPDGEFEKVEAWQPYKESFDAILSANSVCESLFVELQAQLEVRESLPRHMPPLLNPGDCPPISVITLVHNRPKFIENACLNLLHSDYPRDKIEWVIVDDSDPTESASNKIIQFGEKFEPGTVKYIPLIKKHTIGAKRNIGVSRASHNILVVMDDDDHYPITSFRRRVAYLLKARKRYECAVCTTIAMYDLRQGTSAVNVPPYNLGLAQRCSEATLTFTRDFWTQKPFPETNLAEGEGFLSGRESQVLEMPPQQIIVALSHGSNISDRKMPNAGNGCFWGFSKPLLIFLHGLIGVQVEEEK